jgi:hypothetical protein
MNPKKTSIVTLSKSKFMKKLIAQNFKYNNDFKRSILLFVSVIMFSCAKDDKHSPSFYQIEISMINALEVELSVDVDSQNQSILYQDLVSSSGVCFEWESNGKSSIKIAAHKSEINDEFVLRLYKNARLLVEEQTNDSISLVEINGRF